MPTKAGSTKRALIDQANTRVVIFTGVAAFVFIFCAVATKTLAAQVQYQNHVISAKKVAVNQLKADLTAVNSLKSSYVAFTTTPQNVLGGNPTGTGPQDGDNAKIVLDALPSSYDFPALATSIDSLLSSQGVKITSITGTDDQIAQSTNKTSSAPTPVLMPFQVAVEGDYPHIQGLISTFENSIRPIQIQSLTISGGQSDLSLNVTAQTYYQPSKSLNITSKVVTK